MERPSPTFFGVYFQLGGEYRYVIQSQATSLAGEQVPGTITKLHNLTKDRLEHTTCWRMKVKLLYRYGYKAYHYGLCTL